MLQVEHVSHCFGRDNDANPTGIPVIDDVDLTIETGQFVSFLGPSGCGKTTLLRIIHGLLRPQSGSITIDGHQVKGPDARCAMVFQEFNLFPWRTVVKNVEVALESTRRPSAERRERAMEALSTVGLSDFADYYPYQLSGGMKQRVGIARALVGEPPYLLMDEPFGALDPLTREVMQTELLKILDNQNKTIVFVTHSIEEAIYLSDRVVVFSARPCRVKEILTVTLPQRRWQDPVGLKSCEEAQSYRKTAWELLQSEVSIS